ncbi:MAG: DUF192 domain-containing protein [Gemmatimonadota bacterium]
MLELHVVNRTRGAVLGEHVALADRWWLRMRGLLGRPRIEEGQGMLLTPCTAVHMRGMRYPLDVAILARDGRVVAVYPSLPPGGRTAWRHPGGHAALELPAGTLGSTGTAPGDVLAWSPSNPGRGIDE